MILDAALPPTPEGIDETAWAAAIGAIRGYCGWHIAPNLPETVELDGSGGELLVLPTLRLTELVSVTNGETVLDVADLKWSERGVVRGARWSSSYRGIPVVFEHGFEFFPHEVLAVARSLASAGPNGSPGKRLTSGPHSIELAEHAAGPFALGPLHEAILDRYAIGNRP